MMNLETVKNNINRGRLSFDEINWMLKTIDFLEEENGNMAEKHADKDLAIRDLMQMNLQQKQRIAELEAIKEMYLNANNALLDEIELYKLQETKLLAQVKMMKNNSRLNSFYQMSEENLKMAQELERLREIERKYNNMSTSIFELQIKYTALKVGQ